MPTITRTETLLRDVDEAYAFIESTYVRMRARRATRVLDNAFAVRTATSGTIRADRVSSGLSSAHTTEPREACAFVHCRAGHWAFDAGAGGSGVIGPGDVVRYPSGHSVDSTWDPFDVLMLEVPFGEMARVAEESTGMPASAFSFSAMTPLSPQMGAYWTSALTHCAQELWADPSTLASPLVHQSALDALCAGALATFPNTTWQAAARPGRAGATTVRRAQAFIDDAAATPITESDIARASGSTPRSLRLAFHRNRGTTPRQYLRLVRRAAARREAVDADPAAMPEIARRWGVAPGDLRGMGEPESTPGAPPPRPRARRGGHDDRR